MIVVLQEKGVQEISSPSDIKSNPLNAVFFSYVKYLCAQNYMQKNVKQQKLRKKKSLTP